jgi:hypothetical protein
MTLPGASRGGSLANVFEDKAATCRRLLPCKPSTLASRSPPDLEEAKPAAPARRSSRLCRRGAVCTKAVLLLAALLLCTGWRPAVAAILWAVVVRSNLGAASEMLIELVSSHCTSGTVVSFAPDEVLPWAPSLRAAHAEVHRELLRYESTAVGRFISPPLGAVDPVSTRLYRGGCWHTLWLLVYGRETVWP